MEVAEFLLERGADVNAQDKGGLIPLHNASSYGHLDIAALLIKYNTVVNATDKWGFTPLHEAAQKGRTQLCALLLAHGADPFLKNQEGQTPVDLASADDVRCLLQDAMASQQIVPSVPSGNMVNSTGGNSINSRPPSIVSGKRTVSDYMYHIEIFLSRSVQLYLVIMTQSMKKIQNTKREKSNKDNVENTDNVT